MFIPYKLKEIRKETNYTQKQLGCSIGVSQATIGMYETGKRVPNINKICEISRVLKCSVSDLMDENIENTNKVNLDRLKVLVKDIESSIKECNKILYTLNIK